VKVHRIAAFTKDGAGGNPAGVVVVEALPEGAVMQRIAAKVRYSETVFAAPAGSAWLTRFFSPESEVPFCGHATIALGAVLGSLKGSGTYELSLSRDRISVQAMQRDGNPYCLLRSPPTRSDSVPQNVLQEALALFGYRADDLDVSLTAMRVDAGEGILVLPLRTRAALAAMNYGLKEGREFMRRHGFITVNLVWRETERVFHSRNAFAWGGVLEDPATGAAAAALGGMLRDRQLANGELTIFQGEDMGQPCRIDVAFSGPPGSPVHVGGSCAVIQPAFVV
jgi:PhzF family phenazine biosynthesis protein